MALEVSEFRITLPGTLLRATIMSLEAARNLPIPDLLRVLNEKLGLEYTRLQEAPIPCTVPVSFLRSEVSEPRLTHLDKRGSGV